MVEAQRILLRPILTEKATTLTERRNQVFFRVADDANKHQIRSAVEGAYGVKVEEVHTMIVHGKLKRRGTSVGKRPNWKKASVTLRKGDSIDFFATE